MVAASSKYWLLLPPKFPRLWVVAQTGVEIPALLETGLTEVSPA